MGDLWDGILGFFDTSKKRTDEEKARNAIAVIQGCQDMATLIALIPFLPVGIVSLPIVAAAIDVRKKTLVSQGTSGPYADVAKGLYEGFQVLAPVMGKAATDAIQVGLTTATPSANALAAAITDPLVGAMVQIMQAGGQQVPADVQTRLKSVLLPALSMGLTLEIATNLAELIHPTKEMGFTGISHFIHDTVGFAAMSESYVNPIRRALIEIPTEKNIMHLTQPQHPPSNMARDFTQKRLMSVDEYAEDLRYDGIMEDAVLLAKDAVWRELSMRDMQRMFDIGRPDSAWIHKKVVRMGFRDEDVDKIVDSLNKRAVTAEIGSLKALQRAQYKSGVLTRAEYSAILTGRGITVDEAKGFLDAIDRERIFDDHQQLQKAYELKYLQGRSTEAQLRAALATLGVLSDVIDARVKYLVQQRLGKLSDASLDKVLSRADILKEYSAGKITKAAANAALDNLGYTLQDAMAITDLQDADTLDDLRAEKIRAAEEAAKNRRLSLTDLETVYQANGKTQAWATARADYIEQVILGKLVVTTTAPEADSMQAVRDEIIRAAEQEAKNLRLSYDQLVDVYQDNGKTYEWARARADYIEQLVLGKERTE